MNRCLLLRLITLLLLFNSPERGLGVRAELLSVGCQQLAGVLALSLQQVVGERGEHDRGVAPPPLDLVAPCLQPAPSMVVVCGQLHQS